MASATRAVLSQHVFLSLLLPTMLTLAVEDVAAHALADGHAQVDVQANAGDAHAGVVLVLGQEKGVVMVVVVVVRVAGMAACLRLYGRGHGQRGSVSSGVGGRGPVERRRGGRAGAVAVVVGASFGGRLCTEDA